jgi:uncharacterized protein YutE (UPF0331/DUF86 family)
VIYKVDVPRIERQLSHLQTCAHVIESIGLQQMGLVERFAVERAFHVAVECMIEVGSVLIDGFIMRDPGGYLDIVDIMEDEQVIPPFLAAWLKEQVQMRGRLMRDYDKVTQEELEPLMGSTDRYRTFIQQVRLYLQTELGSSM